MKLILGIMLMMSLPLAWAQKSEVITGELMLTIEDDFEREISREIYHISEAKTSKMHELKFPDDKVPQEIRDVNPGSKIKIRGKKNKENKFLYEKIEK